METKLGSLHGKSIQNNKGNIIVFIYQNKFSEISHLSKLKMFMRV